jgi:diguanylate cyclase (GGDEF)-like protein/PAS domain S-box-containing protein
MTMSVTLNTFRAGGATFSEPMEDGLIYAEQVRLLYRLSLVGYLATLLAALALGAVLWNELSRPALFVWLAFICLITIARYGLYKAYMGAKPGPDQAPAWGTWFVVGTGLMGFGWAVVGTILFPVGNLFNEMSVVMLIALLNTGALAEHAPHRPAFVSYVVPSLVPLAFNLLFMRDRNHLLLGLMLLALLALLLFIHSRANLAVIEALGTRFKNLSLASSLETERQQSREAVLALVSETKERQRVESHARVALQKLSLHAEHSPIALIEWDMNLCVSDWNQAAERIFGYTSAEVMGRHLSDFVPADVRPTIKQLWEELAAKKEGTHGVTNSLTKDGRNIVCDWYATPIYDNDQRMIGIASIINDITDRTHADKTVQYLANHDPLTALPNRRMMQERLSQAIAQARRAQRHVAVLYLDLDRFKLINDTLGHEAGDDVLRTMAKRLQESVREEDVVSREGGDEFIIILPNLEDVKHARVVANKVLKTMSAPFDIGNSRFNVTSSIGISFFPDNAQDAHTLLKHADAAMYNAKKAGRNTLRFFTEDLQQMLSKRLELETRLRHAIDNKEFMLVYQPQVDLASGRIRSMEALLRWKNPQQAEEIFPRQFVTVLEEMGIIAPVGDWVLAHACAQAKRWEQAGYSHLVMSVNLSARQLLSRNLPQQLRELLKQTGLDPAKLELEISETAAMHNPVQTAEIMAELRDLGVGLTLDEFGIGRSSLSELKRFPIKSLKISRNFIDGIPGDAEDKTISEAVIAMAKRLSLRVVAVGVETKEQIEFLRASQCDAIQGYVFSKPLNAEDADSLLRSGRGL